MDSVKVADQLSKLLDELDEESLAKMSDSDVLEMRKQLNPYGRTIEGSDKILTYSYTDLRHEYLKKMVITGMVGFLNRMCDEWKVPDGIPVITVYDYVKDPSKLDEFEKTLKDPEIMRKDLNLNREYMAKRIVIKEFLEDMFQYNPDFHVRSSYRPNLDDPERKIVDTPAGHLAIYQLKKTDPEFNEKWRIYEREQKLQKDTKGDDETKKDENIESDVRKRCSEMIVPADIFHRYQYYYDSHYEELKDIVGDLYCDKCDLETAINPYSWHDTEDDADKFIDKHQNEVITSIYKSFSGKWNIFAPYKKVRESMRYFNKKTMVLEEIAKQIERDAKLGADLMKKRIKVKKQKNIKEEGPDDPAFTKWRETNDTLKDMGAESINQQDYAPSDCPPDSITVPVFRIGGGGQTFEKTHFFSQAEAPTIVNGQEIG
jgi:hypothetical protein